MIVVYSATGIRDVLISDNIALRLEDSHGQCSVSELFKLSALLCERKFGLFTGDE